MKSYLYSSVRAFLTLAFLTLPLALGAQVPSVTALSQADSLRKEYLFEASMQKCEDAARYAADSLVKTLLEDVRLQSENGLQMMDFVSDPRVVARHRFSLDEFYLYYPLQDKSWREFPNVLDTLGNHPFSKAAYVPQGSRSILYSGTDESGSRNLYVTDSKDTTWSIPYILNEHLMSSGDEIYPMVTPDGKYLHFASSGLYGMGGYDLYVSEWDEEAGEWGAPTNMGFPYSSPADDFLYINTSDGKYSIFASNRDCPADSVNVYVLQYEPMPVRKSIRSISRLKTLMQLAPDTEEHGHLAENPAALQQVPENVDTRRYVLKVNEVKALKDSISLYNRSMDRLRAAFAEGDADKDRIAAEILVKEAALPIFQDSLFKASSELQKIEMEFLFKGVVLDPEKIMYEADKKVEVASSSYAFSRMNPGEPLDIVLEQPEVKFDYTFMILPEGRFAEDNNLPQGIVYQIQIFSLVRKAQLRDLKGLSPVFEERTSSGRYIYRVGLFRKYNDALAQLNKVKRLGFKTAFVTPFKDGKTIAMSKARSLEQQVRTVTLYQINIVPPEGVLPDITKKVIAQMSGKDIAKSEKSGRTVFMVGTFDSLEQVEKVIAGIKATGVTDVSPVKIGTREIK